MFGENNPHKTVQLQKVSLFGSNTIIIIILIMTAMFSFENIWEIPHKNVVL